MGFDRIQRVHWSDILMGQNFTDDFTYETAKMVGPASLSAVPAVYEVKITKTGISTAEDTIIIGGTTFTAKETPSTDSGTMEFATDATAAEVAAIVQAKGLANFTLTVSGAIVTYTQTTAGTGDAITIGTGVGTDASATVNKTQDYIPSNAFDPQYQIEPGDPVYLISTDSTGKKTVGPIDATSTSNINAFCGFVRERYTLAKNEVENDMVIATGGCRLDLTLLPETDQFGHLFSWNYASGSIREKAEVKNFRFGKSSK